MAGFKDEFYRRAALLLAHRNNVDPDMIEAGDVRVTVDCAELGDYGVTVDAGMGRTVKPVEFELENGSPLEQLIEALSEVDS